MNIALDRLDELLTGPMMPDSPEMRSLDPGQLQSFREQALGELRSIRSYLWRVPEKVRNRKQGRIIIRQFYHSIKLLAGQLENYLMDSRGETAQSLFYRSLHLEMGKLISILDRHFSEWLDCPEKGRGFFLYSQLNEAELSALLSSLVDCAVFCNHTYTSLFQQFAPMLATRHKKGLLASSMLKSRDKLTPDMKKRVKGILMDMARAVDGY